MIYTLTFYTFFYILYVFYLSILYVYEAFTLCNFNRVANEESLRPLS
jgi:hypothetical protein